MKDKKTSLSGKAVCEENTGECSGFDHPAMKSEVTSLEVVNWHSWAITSQCSDFSFSESFRKLF